MIRAALQGLTRIPSFYAISQHLAGVRTVHERLSLRLARQELGAVLDVGGGIGLARPLCTQARSYTCLEYVSRALYPFHHAYPLDGAVLGDAAHLPFHNGVFDTLLCIMVLHHLDDDAARDCIVQSARVLSPKGRVLIVEPLWNPSLLRSRFLWRLDRGNYPRSLKENLKLFDNRFLPTYTERFSVHHEYLLYEGHPW